MNTVQQPSWVLALAAFASVALATIAIAALVEAGRVLMRERQMRNELKRLGERSLDGTPAANTLLRAKGKGLPPWLQPALARVPRLGDLQSFLERSGTGLTIAPFLAITVGAAIALGFAFTVTGRGIEVGLVAAAIGASLPYFWLARRGRKRMAAFEAHLPEAIDLLTRSIRAGHGVSTGLGMVAEEAAEPVASEFRQIFEELRYGLPLDESLNSMCDRVTLPDVRIFATALLIQRDVGGNLAEILEKLSSVIRERFTFRRQLRTHTAQGRMTGMFLGAAPVIAGLGLFLINPDYMRPLIEEPMGRLMLAAAIALQAMGYMVIRRLTDVEL